MNIPKYVGVVFCPAFGISDSIAWKVCSGDNEEVVRRETLFQYNELVENEKANGEGESTTNEIGWDIYVSTRASANSPDAIHGKFEGPGA